MFCFFFIEKLMCLMMECVSSLNFANFSSNKATFQTGVCSTSSLFTNLGCWVLLFVFPLIALGLWVFGLRVLRFGFRFLHFWEKSNDLSNGFLLGIHFNDVSCSNISSFKSKEEKVDQKEEDDSDKEDEEMDVVALRKALKIQRERARSAYIDLEKERVAAATAADEAMAMILRLQNEKSVIELEANQFRRLAEQKQVYDQEVIHHLKWLVLKHESERGLLESRFNVCRQRLKNCLKFEEVEGLGLSGGNALIANFGDDLAQGLVSSLDLDSTF